MTALFPEFDDEWMSSQHFLQESEKWRSRVTTSAREWVESKRDVSEWMFEFTRLRDRVLQRLWSQAVPIRYREKMEYIVLGSGARHEDLLYSDFDHALILEPHLDGEVVRPYLHQFVRQMQQFGFPVCQGFVMSTNPRWVGSEDEWNERIHGYFQFPDWENARYLFILLDGRVLPGPSHAWDRVVEWVFNGIRDSSFICWEMAHLGIHRTVAMGLFGKVRTLAGERGTTVNVKEGLLNPIIHSVRLTAIAYGCGDRSTLQRIECLTKQGAFPEPWKHRITAALQFGWRLRLAQQVADLQQQRVVSDHIQWAALELQQREEIVFHLETAKQLERWTHRRFPKPR